MRSARNQRHVMKKTMMTAVTGVLMLGCVTVLQQPAEAAPAPAAPAADSPAAAAPAVVQDTVVPPRVVSPAELQKIRAKATATGDGCGSSCDNKDPATYKNYYSSCSTCYYYCSDDAYTVYDAPDVPSGPWVELRYSPRCQTAWARAGGAWTPQVNSYYMSGSKRTSAGSVSASVDWTKMLNDHNLLAEACAYNGPTTTCTKRY